MLIWATALLTMCYILDCSIEARHVTLTADQTAIQIDRPRQIEVFRPVQYLGSKMRSLAAITEVVDRLSPGGPVMDAFSGTSVVGQALASHGHRVLASDAMGFASLFAKSMLGVDRQPIDTADLISQLRTAEDYSWFEPWSTAVASEDEAVRSLDGPRLIELSLGLPQVWRNTGGDEALNAQLEIVRGRVGRSTVNVAPIAATHYAGTYFGIRQALEIDALRQGIWSLKRAALIGEWGEGLLLTALLAAASEAAFSAGKHFAQPHAIHRQKDLTFAARRIVEDRRKSIRLLFDDRLTAALRLARPATENHIATQATVDSLPADWWRQAAVVYADPPYTAQQYSRFYHVPEVLVNYRVPALEMIDSQPTRGLYPEGRYKSPYSSRAGAPVAFAHLCGSTADARASLVISYSASVNGQTGNDRMISLPDLLDICARSFGRPALTVVSLDHEYRQFNGELLAVDARQDREYLVVCRGPA